ncbi:unnamed protein product [Prorocentrum cordatum]|nr:unnamed protein product [Polarella glacialis]
MTLANLGVACGELGDHCRERELLERALEIQERAYGPDHHAVGTTLANLGNAHGRLGDPGRQRELLERALGILQAFHGPEHPGVATILTNLGIAHGQLGDAPRREELLQRALRIQAGSHGYDRHAVETTKFNLAHSMFAQGKKDGAVALMQGVCNDSHSALGQEHPLTHSARLALSRFFGGSAARRDSGASGSLR